MNEQSRIPHRIEPHERESPYGYLCRVASEYDYTAAGWLSKITGLGPAGQIREIERVAEALRLQPEEWRSMCYLPVEDRDSGFHNRSFFGSVVHTDQIVKSHPRVCAVCLRKEDIWLGIWDLVLVCTCPEHGCLLTSRCPACRCDLTIHRRSVRECRCGFDLRLMVPRQGTSPLLELTSIIYRAAKRPLPLPNCEGCDLSAAPELSALPLHSLLSLISQMGSARLRTSMRKNVVVVTDLNAAIRLCEAAARCLLHWPHGFHDLLREMAAERAEEIRLSKVFGDLYRHLLRSFPLPEFAFVRNAFEQFLATEWRGVLRGQTHSVSPLVLRSRQWMPQPEALRVAEISVRILSALVEAGTIECRFVRPEGSRIRIERWIERGSLQGWIEQRNQKRAQFGSVREVRQVLGISEATLAVLAADGILHQVEGSNLEIGEGRFYDRADVAQIIDSFDAYASEICDSTPPGAIRFGEAIRLFAGRSGAGSIISSVLDGRLKPIARLRTINGIAGYCFEIGAMRAYRNTSPATPPPPEFLTYDMAAHQMGTNTEVIRGLVVAGHLRSTRALHGRSKLVLRGDVCAFGESHIAVSALTKLTSAQSRSLANSLKESGIKVLEIELKGKGRKLFASPRQLAERLIYPNPDLRKPPVSAIPGKRRNTRPQLQA